MKKIKLAELIRESQLQEGVHDPGILKAIFTGGSPGSGKSYVANNVFGIQKLKSLMATFTPTGLKVVNSDIAFEKMLKDANIDVKKLGQIEKSDPSTWDAVQNIRGKAKQVTSNSKEGYIQGRLGMIIDGTASKLDLIINDRSELENLGYDTYLIFVNTSLEVAKQRNARRDRTLSDEMVTDMWNKTQQNLGKLQRLFGRNNVIIIDNTVEGPVADSVQKSINSIISAPLKNIIGKRWIQSQKQKQ